MIQSDPAQKAREEDDIGTDIDYISQDFNATATKYEPVLAASTVAATSNVA